jgi:hypothetical protein
MENQQEPFGDHGDWPERFHNPLPSLSTQRISSLIHVTRPITKKTFRAQSPFLFQHAILEILSIKIASF